MRTRQIILVPAALAVATTLAAGTLTAIGPADWSRERKEAFLREAKVVKSRELSVGITNSSKLTLSDGDTTHAAHFQTIDEYKREFQSMNGTELNFKDCYKYNIAAYKLSQMLGLGMVPVSVERKVGGATGAVTWWVDDLLMYEKERYHKHITPPDNDHWNSQMFRARVFNELIYNTDANLGNLVITNDWDIWLIDFTRAFRLHKKVRNKANLTKIDPELLESLKALDEETMTRQLRPCLTKGEIKALLARRDQIVDHFEKKIAGLGAAAVLSDAPMR